MTTTTGCEAVVTAQDIIKWGKANGAMLQPSHAACTVMHALTAVCEASHIRAVSITSHRAWDEDLVRSIQLLVLAGTGRAIYGVSLTDAETTLHLRFKDGESADDLASAEAVEAFLMTYFAGHIQHNGWIKRGVDATTPQETQ